MEFKVNIYFFLLGCFSGSLVFYIDYFMKVTAEFFVSNFLPFKRVVYARLLIRYRAQMWVVVTSASDLPPLPVARVLTTKTFFPLRTNLASALISPSLRLLTIAV